MATKSLQEYVDDVKAKEAITREPDEVTQMLKNAALALITTAYENKPIKVLTDYDADGICSGYITAKLLKAINPKCQVDVQCNDRRGSYGISSDIQGDGFSNYIICDMGGNEVPIIRERLGEKSLVFDHHLITDEEVKALFRDTTGNNVRLCDPHALHDEESENAQYCATGLMYRVYQEAKKILGDKLHTTEKLDNTLAIIACIGTAADMVDVLDTKGYNRDILKKGCELIEKADATNVEFPVGYMLQESGLKEQVTARDVAYNTGSFLNCGGRMSEFINENGAQKAMQALLGDEKDWRTYTTLDEISKLNAWKKDYVAQLTSGEVYDAFCQKELFGENRENNIAVYVLPEGTPHGMAGLVAGRLTENLDKAVICLAYNEDVQGWAGSCRNANSNVTALNKFMEAMLAQKNEVLGEDNELEVKYGGHANAMGISKINNLDDFMTLFNASTDLMVAKSIEDKLYLGINTDDLQKPQLLLDTKALLEPMGIGNDLPPALLLTKIRSIAPLSKNIPNEHWKRVNVEGIDTIYFNYYPETLAKGADGLSAVSAKLSANTWLGNTRLQLDATIDRAVLNERQKELEAQKETKAVTSKKENGNPELG